MFSQVMTIWNRFANFLFNRNVDTPDPELKKIAMYDVITVNPTLKIFSFFCKSVQNDLKRVKNTKPPTHRRQFRPILPQVNVNTSYHTECPRILSINMTWVKKHKVSWKCVQMPPLPYLNLTQPKNIWNFIFLNELCHRTPTQSFFCDIIMSLTLSKDWKWIRF